jgi:hypothetical protein
MWIERWTAVSRPLTADRAWGWQMAHGWIVGIILGYIAFNAGLWKSDSAPKPQDTVWAFVMLAGTVLMFLSVLLWAVPDFFKS